MASASLFSQHNAGFKYGGGPTTFQLAQPIRFEAAADIKFRSATDSMDRANREIITIGSKVEEATIVIRYDDDPGGLRDMLEAGADGTEIDYYPDLGSGTNYPMVVITDRHDIAIQPDPDRHVSHGEWMASVRVRAVSGSFDAILT